jgi:hypothetical protein
MCRDCATRERRERRERRDAVLLFALFVLSFVSSPMVSGGVGTGAGM